MSKAKEKITAKDPNEKLAHQRLSVLQLAEALDNVSEACRRSGMDRTSFYAWKERFRQRGLEGLKDLPPVPKSHPFTTAPEVVEQVLATSMRYPKWGCTKVSDHLRLQGISVSSPTVQHILIKHSLASKYERMLELERRHLQEGLELTPDQVQVIEKANPCFRERHVESSGPGELLSQDTFFIGHIKGIGKVYLHAVVDTYSSYGFGFLHPSKQPEAAVAVVHNEVIPFYRHHDLEIGAILTDNGREFCGTQAHPYELYLALNDVEHRRTQVRRPQTNGFAERFNRTFQEEFVEVAFRRTYFESVEAVQQELDLWLDHYNRERPHRGYRNMGRRPYETILHHLQSVRQEA